MSEFKLTPGPWTAKELSGYQRTGFVVLWPDTSKGGIYERRLDDSGRFTEHEAKLIAAAPELLQALTNLVGLARLGAARIDKYHAALAVADAAILKATA